MTSALPMPSTKIAEGRYAVLGTSREVIVERRGSMARNLTRWALLVDGALLLHFDTKRAALVYCQEHPEL